VARPAESSPENVPGDLFVDSSCIACDTCRRVAPGLFGGGEDEPAFVARQPVTALEDRRALMALVACPVSAIGSRTRRGPDIARAARAFPDPVPGVPGLYHCGYAARSSFGASSWLLVREGGNVLVDSPRFALPLVLGLRALGGVRFHFLTHRDDVADHARLHEALGGERILHEDDLTPATSGVERLIRGERPVALAADLLVLPLPGHTRGSAALLARGELLFSGDHLWGDASGHLDASREVCWYDYREQTRSMERLCAHPFRAVFPGHGRPFLSPSAALARAELEALVARMRRS